jgi:hypothetical protein
MESDAGDAVKFAPLEGRDGGNGLHGDSNCGRSRQLQRSGRTSYLDTNAVRRVKIMKFLVMSYIL